MIQIVAFIIEHFSDLQACPMGKELGIMLEDAGFDDDEIHTTLFFLHLLETSQHDFSHAPHTYHPQAMRIYNADELDALPSDVRGFLHFLEQAQAIHAGQREFIVHALMHLPYDEITLDTAKMLALLILWAHRSELPVLIGEELMAILHGKGVMQ